MDDKCFYCSDTGYIHTNDDIPDQMCPYCEIGQAVIKGYNVAREIGIQACDTLEAAKNERIKELEACVKEWRDKADSELTINAKLHTETAYQAPRIKELENLLTEYGRHQEGCSAQYNTAHSKYRCRCGWKREREKCLSKP